MSQELREKIKGDYARGYSDNRIMRRRKLTKMQLAGYKAAITKDDMVRPIKYEGRLERDKVLGIKDIIVREKDPDMSSRPLAKKFKATIQQVAAIRAHVTMGTYKRKRRVA